MEHTKNLSSIKTLESLSGMLQGKRVFLRADFNVPIQDGKITDTYRIDTTMDTFMFLKKEGAITVVVSHIETKDVDAPSLQLVFNYIQKTYSEYSVVFCENFLDLTQVQTVLASVKNGDFILFENIRNAKETGMSEKGNDEQFALYLKQFADFYIQDAFAVSHREHTSVSKLPALFDADHKVSGIQLYKEITSLSKTIHPQAPFVVILSGAKFGTKLPLVEKYLKTADIIFVGGALYNNVLKSLGYEVGVSLVDPDAVYVDALVKREQFTKKVYIPKQVVVKDVETGIVRVTEIEHVNKTETIQDIAPESIREFISRVAEVQAKTVLWNGPVGNFEVTEFSHGTDELGCGLLDYIKQHDDAHLFIGGGDTVSAISHIEGVSVNKNIFVSTGGGAMLEFLEKDGNIPGIMSLLA